MPNSFFFQTPSQLRIIIQYSLRPYENSGVLISQLMNKVAGSYSRNPLRISRSCSNFPSRDIAVFMVTKGSPVFITLTNTSFSFSQSFIINPIETFIPAAVKARSPLQQTFVLSISLPDKTFIILNFKLANFDQPY